MITSDSFFTLTDESRKAYKNGEKREKKIVESPLTLIGRWFADHGRDARGAPPDLLDHAWRHVNIRLEILTKTEQTGRVIAQTKWLRRWLKICDDELIRQTGSGGTAECELPFGYVSKRRRRR